MFGPSAHPMFTKRLQPTQTHPILSRVRGVLGLWNNCYYLHGAFGLITKTYLSNYFNFLCDAHIAASWRIQCLERNGKQVLNLEGDFSNQETVVVDFAEYKGLDEFGIMRVQIIPRSTELFLTEVHATHYDKEFYKPGSPNGIMAHSLHVTRAGHGPEYQRVSPGLLVPDGFSPHLLIASGCNFSPILHTACAKASLQFTNFENAKQTHAVPSMKPGQCLLLDLFFLYPSLKDHIQNKPFGLRVLGENFLAKPFIIFSNGETIMGEHL